MDLEDEDRKKKSKSKMKATKDFKLLSFGAEAEEEEDDLKDIQVPNVVMRDVIRFTLKQYDLDFTTSFICS